MAGSRKHRLVGENKRVCSVVLAVPFFVSLLLLVDQPDSDLVAVSRVQFLVVADVPCVLAVSPILAVSE